MKEFRTKKQFKNIDEIWGGLCYFWRWGMYIDWLHIDRTGKKIALINTLTNQRIEGLIEINKYLKFHEYEIEVIK